MNILSVHHAQITIPGGMEDQARDFYCGLLGLKEIDKPDSLKGRGGLWLQIGAFQVHVSIQDAVERYGLKSHLAYLVDDLEAWRTFLIEAGFHPEQNTPIPGYHRFEFRDPFGNRIEFIQPII
jgi:catechol 2,3-dioxygenase-like lactoylglutathione lyase family enzyme